MGKRLKRHEAGVGERLLALGARIRAARTRAGMTMRQLGKAAGLSCASVCQLEHGRNEPGVFVLGDLAAALGVTPWDLLGEGVGLRPQGEGQKG